MLSFPHTRLGVGVYTFQGTHHVKNPSPGFPRIKGMVLIFNGSLVGHEILRDSLTHSDNLSVDEV